MKKIELTEETRERIEELYLVQNRTKRETAEELGISVWVLSRYLTEFNMHKQTSELVTRRKATNLKKYGVDNPSKSDVVKERIKSRNREKYGANSFTATAEGKRRVAETKERRYGDSRYNNMEKNLETKLERYGNANYNNREAYVDTMRERYGVDNTFQLEEVKHNNIHNIVINKGYNPEFEKYIVDRDSSIEYLTGKNLTLMDLCASFNAPYPVIEHWIRHLNLQDYVVLNPHRSHYEDEIIDYLKSLGVDNIVKNYRDGLEIDIFLPDFNLGIEFNGTYWHSDIFMKKDYHLKKSLYFEDRGIQIIHIYEYEWESMKPKIEQLLRIRAGKVENRIYARQCEVRRITNREARPFNEQTHLQGHRNAKVTYGLFYNDVLVQLMSFSPKKDGWEIIRGCPGSNNIVVGGVSRLFKHFVSDFHPSWVFSYCDYNKFSGRSYEELGMEFIGSTGPDLKYIVRGKVYPRQYGNYKNIKDDIDARIWGAGSKKYLIRFD